MAAGETLNGIRWCTRQKMPSSAQTYAAIKIVAGSSQSSVFLGITPLIWPTMSQLR